MVKKTTLAAAAAALLAAGGLAWLRSGAGAAQALKKLSALRISLELYRQQRGALPRSFGEVLAAGALEGAPELKLPWHLPSSRVRDTPSPAVSDSGGWAYVNDPQDPAFGLVYIDCSHRDEKGRFWSEF